MPSRGEKADAGGVLGALHRDAGRGTRGGLQGCWKRVLEALVWKAVRGVWFGGLFEARAGGALFGASPRRGADVVVRILESKVAVEVDAVILRVGGLARARAVLPLHAAAARPPLLVPRVTVGVGQWHEEKLARAQQVRRAADVEIGVAQHLAQRVHEAHERGRLARVHERRVQHRRPVAAASAPDVAIGHAPHFDGAAEARRAESHRRRDQVWVARDETRHLESELARGVVAAHRARERLLARATRSAAGQTTARDESVGRSASRVVSARIGGLERRVRVGRREQAAPLDLGRCKGDGAIPGQRGRRAHRSGRGAREARELRGPRRLERDDPGAGRGGGVGGQGRRRGAVQPSAQEQHPQRAPRERARARSRVGRGGRAPSAPLYSPSLVFIFLFTLLSPLPASNQGPKGRRRPPCIPSPSPSRCRRR